MIIVEVHYYTKDGMREAFLQRIVEEGIDVASRQDEGNIQYDYFFSPDNKNELLLFEKWESPESLEKHSQAEHLKKMGAFRNDYLEDVTIQRYLCEE